LPPPPAPQQPPSPGAAALLPQPLSPPHAAALDPWDLHFMAHRMAREGSAHGNQAAVRREGGAPRGARARRRWPP
jgi:hypothetical protein